MKVYRDYVAGVREVELARLGAATGFLAQRAAYGPLIDLESWLTGEIRFPPFGLTLNRLTRYLMKQLVTSENTVSGREAAAAARPAVARLLERSLQIGDAEDVPEADSLALAAWIQEVATTLGPGDRLRVQHWCDKALIDTIDHYAARPEVLRRLPKQLLEAARKRYAYSSYLSHNQMLGWAQLSQDVHDPFEKDICLLQLHRSEGGEITIWIDPQDLERRDFSRVQIIAQYG